LVGLSGCGQKDRSAGVELVMSSESPTPGMTFELRFPQPMVKADHIGVTESEPPLVISPSLAGTFTWLSPRSGVFTPTEPLALDTRYRLALRSGLKDTDGAPLRATLDRTLTTPPFGISRSWPNQESTNADADPELKLAFNADVHPPEALELLYFRDASGQRVAADVRQGTEEDGGYWGNRELHTWSEQFLVDRRTGSWKNGEPWREPTNPVPNLLVVTPHEPLPLGKKWRLVVRPGIPAVERALRMRESIEVPIGDVTPFVVKTIVAKNFLNSGTSIQLSFSKTVPDSLTNGISGWMKLNPEPTNITVDVRGSSVIVSGAFESSQWYNVELQRQLQSIDGFKLAGSNVFSLRMPAVAPRLYFPAFSQDQMAGGNRCFQLMAVNVPKVRIRAKLLDPLTAIHALRGYRSYFKTWREREQSEDQDEPYRAVDYNMVPGRTIFDKCLDLGWEQDTARTIELGWDQILSARRAGVVFLEARRTQGEKEEGPNLGSQALIQLTDLGVVSKRSREGVDVFVFSHNTGQPVAQARTRLYSSENEILDDAITDAAGRAHLVNTTNAAWVAVEQSEDFHAVPLRENEVWRYGFDLPFTGSDDSPETRRVLLFSDRNLYRPGETMHLAVLVRDWSEGGLTIPAGLSGTLQCQDARERRFFATNAVVSSSGSWSVDVPLTTTTRGSCLAKLHLGNSDYSYSFLVEDFQPSAFEIALPCKTSYAAGENIVLPLSARYFFGKALSRAQVKWSLEAEDFEFRPAHFESYNFRRSYLEFRFGRGYTSVSLNGQGALTSSNNFVISPDIPLNRTAPQPRSVSLLAEVTDVNQQTLSRQVEFIRHSSDFYLGLREGAAVVEAGRTPPLEVIAVGADGQPWPEKVKAHLNLQRIEWQNVRIQGAGRVVRYRSEAIRTNILDEEVEVQPVQVPLKDEEETEGNRVAAFPPLEAGEYLLEVAAQDSAGRPVVSSLDFNVSAQAETAWNYRNDVELTLKPGQTNYIPGQTAEILVEAPFGGTALVSVEREKVLRSFVTRLEGNAPTIRVPLEPGDVPNVYVSVTLLRGSDECTHTVREPEFRSGYCPLEISDPNSRLTLNITTTATNYLPGQQVEATVEARDAVGQVVSDADVVLYAVDEGILSLGGYITPDAHGFFYAARPLGVASCISLPNLLTEDRERQGFANKGYLAGGGGMERVRKNFLACAFWSALLKTDSAGKATAQFTAPDCLTRYRLIALAHTAKSAFGNGQSDFRLAKPLVIEPSLPQFASILDHLVARGVVNNQTATGGEVLVTLQLDDKAKPSEQNATLSRRTSIAANGSAVVEFPLELADVGTSKWLWKARFIDPTAGNFTDAVESQIEVGHIAPELREVLLSHPTGSESNLLSKANPQLLAGSGTICVTIANTRLSELGEAMSQLLHYPYGCAEQTGSSLLPWLVLRDSTNLWAMIRWGTNNIQAAIQTGIARLFSMQTQSGGLGYWPRDKEPMLWASGYGGMVLALAQRHGVPVPREEFDALMNYLSQSLRSAGQDGGQLSDCCLALYAMALAGRAEPAYHEKFYELREKLSTEDRALLALAIAESRSSEPMISELLHANAASRRLDEERFYCPAREEAIRLLAWTRFHPEDPLLDRLVDDLMREQRQAHWGTTQGDAWAILALTEYSRRVEGQFQPAEFQLKWAGQSIPFRLDERTNLFTQSFEFTNGQFGALGLVNGSNRRLYASVLVEARPAETPQPRQDRGFGLQRRYERLDDDDQPQDVRGALRVGDRVLVTLNLSVRETARWVVIDDALPGILEAINPEFKTQVARSANAVREEGSFWMSDFREIRKDRCLSFCNWVPPGNYTMRYIARVRAAGTVTAPSAKVEEMYHPERCGLSGSETISSEGIQ
jgi:uncharacterized protein YfaS (alpha-2-macroglobulin family)